MTLGMLNQAAPSSVLMLLAAGVLVPALIAALLAGRLDGEERIRRERMLAVLGAGAGQRALVAVAESWRPAAIGCGLSALVPVLLCLTDLRVPWTDATFLAADARAVWPQLVIAEALTPLICLALLVAVQQIRPRRGATLFSPGQPPPWRRGLACAVAVAVTVLLPGQLAPGPARTLTYLTGVILVAVTVPGLLALVLAAVGGGLASVGRRRGSAGLLLAGRRLTVMPLRTVRVAAGVCLLTLGLGQVQLFVGLYGHQYQEAVATREELGGSVLIAKYTSYGQGTASFLAGLPDGVGALWVVGSSRGDQLYASCPALTAVGQPCDATGARAVSRAPERRLLRLLQWVTTAGIDDEPALAGAHVLTGPADLTAMSKRQATLALVSLDGSPLPAGRLQGLGFAHVTRGLGLELPGQGALAVTTVLLMQARWIVLIGLVGLAGLALVTGCALAADVAASGRSTAALTAIFARRRWLTSLAASWTLLPLALASGTGAMLCLALPATLSNPQQGFHASPVLAVASASVGLVVGLVLTAASGRAIVGQGDRWRPGT